MAKGRIGQAQSFPFLVLSAAGGHFHTLLLFADLTMLAGTHLGLFRSEDGGISWRLAAAGFDRDDTHALARDPGSGTLYAATHRRGVLASRDGGRRWIGRSQGLPGRDVHALVLDPRQPHVLYAWLVGHGLFRSEDGAARWSRLAGPEILSGVESLAVHPKESSRLYAGTAKGVWVSEDGGRGWRLPAGGLAYRAAGVSVPPWEPDQLFAATLEGAFVGRGDGTGWEPLGPHPSWWGVITSFAFLPERPGVVFAVFHEGVVASRTAVGDWLPVGSSLAVTAGKTGPER